MTIAHQIISENKDHDGSHNLQHNHYSYNDGILYTHTHTPQKKY